jgi:hypothetical protein
MQSLARVVGLVVAFGLVGGLCANAQSVQFSAAVQYDVSPPLSQLIQQALPPSAEVEQALPAPRLIPLRRIPMPVINAAGAVPTHSGANFQSTATIEQQAKPGQAFQGIGLGLGSRLVATPPDPSGAAGDTQYVEWVNLSFAVFNKSTGAVVAGPAAGNTLFLGFGGPCETTNNGDPVVEFDKAAHRWVLSQFTSTAPYRECVAVSTTPDATGAYYRYAFDMDPEFADYPRMGVWPDGYYFSFNLFDGSTKKFLGGRVCAFDRVAMLAGLTTAQQECFNAGPGVAGIVPSDWDGPTPPPLGSPNYFLQVGETAQRQSLLVLYQFHADFTNPAKASFITRGGFPVDRFVPACREVETIPLGKQVKLEDPDATGKGCVPQKGVAERLDELSDRMMYRAAYRNFGDHESLVATHTVDPIVDGKVMRGAAIRWYELRNLATTPTLFQQGTFGPTPHSHWRWLGSIGMDRVGDIAAGYSFSGTELHPGIAFAGRTPDDPAGQLAGETILRNGTGSQQLTHRWGDYSALSIDPSDDCTFWYANEYIQVTGPAPNWSTWIASFKYPGCQ